MSTSCYDLYKPLRNHLKQLPLLDSLGVVRAYVQNLQFNQPLPLDVNTAPYFLQAKSRLEKHVYEWELDIIAKEIIINTETDASSTNTLKEWNYFSSTINKLKDLENNIALRYNDLFKNNILIELYRLAHRQFPWQSPPNLIWITRYYKIFGALGVDAIIQRKIGLTTKELYKIGLGFIGLYLDMFALYYPPKIDIAEIDIVKLDKFLKHFSIDMLSLKELIIKGQSYDQDYAYTFSPLRIFPIIKTIFNSKEALICPIPTFLFRRFTEGVYYEICRESDFDDPFGNSFEKYIGEVLKEANKKSSFDIFPEEEFYDGKNRKDSVDWIISDIGANLFIECKTKKLRIEAKISLVSQTILDEELDKMSDFIIQTYKTIADYKTNKYPSFKNNQKPIYPLIVTLEDWFAFGDKLVPALDSKVSEKLDLVGIDRKVLEECPYSICSTHEFETAVQVMNSVGINPVMKNKTTGEKRLWTLGQFIYTEYPTENSLAKDLFPNTIKEILS